MPGRNLETVLRAFDAYNRRDVPSLVEIAGRDFEWKPHMAVGLEGERYRGRAGIERYFQEADELWEGLLLEVEETLERGDVVLVGGWIRARGRGSGVEVNLPLTWRFDLRDGKLTRCVAYQDRQEAIRGVGRPAVGGELA